MQTTALRAAIFSGATCPLNSVLCPSEGTVSLFVPSLFAPYILPTANDTLTLHLEKVVYFF
jgi:hypothetical protein